MLRKVKDNLAPHRIKLDKKISGSGKGEIATNEKI